MTDGGYSIGAYDAMFADTVRGPAYLAAIAEVVRPGDVVLEVGTGTGYYAIAAVRAGARHVYAVERARTTGLARLVAEENGCADRITFIRGDAATVRLPEKADVLLCDLRGATPLFGDGIATVVAVRARHLNDDARIIPLRDELYGAPCTAPREWAATELALGPAPHGIRRGPLARVVRSELTRDTIGADELLAAPTRLHTIDYASVSSADLDVTTEWVVSVGGEAHGIALWFDAHLSPTARFTTAPGGPRSVYGQGFLPWERPVTLAAGERVTCRLRAKVMDGRYIFAWDTSVSRADGTTDEMHQSSLAALLGSEAELMRRRNTFVPAAEEYRDVQTLLRFVDGKRSVADIAREVFAALPERFDSTDDAFVWVSAMLAAVAEAAE
jgi:protein arginine N-methyltransferase 1